MVRELRAYRPHSIAGTDNAIGKCQLAFACGCATLEASTGDRDADNSVHAGPMGA